MTDLQSDQRAALTDALPLSPDADPLTAFVERATAAGVQIYDVPPGGDHDTVVGEILASVDPGRIALSADADVRQACLYFGAGAVSGETDRAVLEGCAIGVTEVHGAVADLGALVLTRDAEAHRLGTLVPDVFVALVARRQVVPVFADLAGSPGPEGVVFVVGPRGPEEGEAPERRRPREVHVVLHGA